MSGTLLVCISRHKNRKYDRSFGAISTWRYISAISHKTATGFLRKRSSTSASSRCSVGSCWIIWFRDTLWQEAEASNTILFLLWSYLDVSEKSVVGTKYSEHLHELGQLCQCILYPNNCLQVQCYAWTEYKFTYVCLYVCLLHFLSTRLQVRPLNGFLQLIA